MIETTELREFINRLRGSPYIREKRFGDISSFNFTRNAFYSSQWNELTVKARGLFINTRTAKIVARGYDKFFNIDENPQTTMEEIRKKAAYPIEVYRKENGFLGLISWDHEKNDFFFATKSMIEGPYADTLKRIFFNSGVNTEAVRQYLSAHDVTMIVEVIDPVFDPHIIEYKQEKIVLLDLVLNRLNPSYIIYPSLAKLGAEFNMEVKKKEASIVSWGEVAELKAYCEHPNGGKFEGYVLRDRNGYMVKLKTAYYLRWKRYRRYADMILRGLPFRADPDPFLSWVEENKDILTDKSIIDMRNLYEKTHSA